MSNLTTQNQNLKGLLESDSVKSRIKEILGKNASTFTTSVVQIASQNDMLVKAEPASIVGAAMTAATLNLPLNNSLGYAWLVPYNEKQKDGSYKTKATFQIGYKGFVQLAMRSGQFKTIHATDVREGEIISRDRLTGEMEFQWESDDKKREKMPKAGYVAYFKLLSGYEATFFMSMDELNAHGKKFSQTFKKGFGLWQTDFDSMAQKTVLKLLLSKYAPLSIDMQTAVTKDQAAFNDVEDSEDITYVDNETPELDHDLERQKTLVETAETLDDITFAEEHITDPVLKAELDLKKIELKKAKKK